jgi:hypothetical protein
MKRKDGKANSRQVITSHGSRFILSLLQVLLGQLQVEIELDLFLLQFSKLGPELTRFLQSMNKTSSSHHGKKSSKTTAESNIRQ